MTRAGSFELTHVAGNNKGTLSAKHHRKPDTRTREQARRINNLDLKLVTTGWRFESSPVHHSFVLSFQQTNSRCSSLTCPREGTKGNNKAATFATTRRFHIRLPEYVLSGSYGRT